MNENDALRAILPEAGQIVYDAPLKRYTTFRVGGPADILVTPHTEAQIAALIEHCRVHACPYAVIGAGSNLLVSDRGYRGLLIRLHAPFNAISAAGSRLQVNAGSQLSALARQAARLSLSGLEFAEGIPGTVGGGVVMNAGAYGGEMSQVVTGARVLAPASGEFLYLPREELQFAPRQSVFQTQSFILLQADFALTPDQPEAIRERMRDCHQRRAERQPLNEFSAGSVFKRPPGFYAGAMIEELGLKGFAIGGAAVSEKHAGFIVNQGTATAEDIFRLLHEVKRRVEAAYPVILEPEIKLLGEF